MLKKAAASKGVWGTLVGAGVGGAAYFVAAKAAPKIPVLQGRWWATPTALLLLGHLTKRYSQETGQAVVGAAGALMAFSYYLQAAAAPAATTTAPASGLFQGEAGAYGSVGPGDAGALQLGPGNTSAGYTMFSRSGRIARSEAGALIT